MGVIAATDDASRSGASDVRESGLGRVRRAEKRARDGGAHGHGGGSGGSARVEARGVGLRRPFAHPNGSPLGARARRCGSTIRNRERGSRGRGNGRIFSTHAGVSSAPGRPRLLGDFLLSRAGSVTKPKRGSLASRARSPSGARGATSSHLRSRAARLLAHARRISDLARLSRCPRRSPTSTRAPGRGSTPASTRYVSNRVPPRPQKKRPERGVRSLAAALRATRPGRARALVFSTHSPPRPRPARAARRASPSPAVVFPLTTLPPGWDPPPPPPRARPSLSAFRTTSCTRRTTTRA